MSIEPIGIIVFLLCGLGLYFGMVYSFSILIQCTLLGSAAAILVGSATIQPGHLTLLFIILAIATKPNLLATALYSLKPSTPAFWLAIMVAYGLIGGFFFPRLFSGTTVIIPIGTSAYEENGSSVPISPVSGNFTQPIYLIFDVLCFILVATFVSNRNTLMSVSKALVIYAVLNILFAVLDVVTYSTGTQEALAFIRNAQYAFHLEEETSGLKRIAGSFTEASSFAQATLGAFAYVASLWIGGVNGWKTGFIALASVALVVLSTSSTGLVALVPTVVILYLTALHWFLIRPTVRCFVVLIGAPLLAPIVAIGIALSDQLTLTIFEYVNTLVLNKATSQSGIERSTWNVLAYRNFIDSWGLGVGLGTARASSFVTALLSNVGLFGSICYLIFLYMALFRGTKDPSSSAGVVQAAARNAALTILVAQCVSGALVDQGLIFYIFAAVAATSFNLPTNYTAISAKRLN